MTDLRLHQLRRAADRAKGRVRYYQNEIARFDRDADPAAVMFDRPRAKLVGDLRKAELDAAWAEIALADATAPLEVPESVDRLALVNATATILNQNCRCG